MARKDFAHVKAPTQQEKKSTSALLPVAVVAIAILCFSAGYWIASEQQAQGKVSQSDRDARQALVDASVAQNNILQAKIDVLEERVALWKSKARQDAHSKVGDLQFYTDLPKQSVMPSPVVEPAKIPEQAKVPAPVQAVAHAPTVSHQAAPAAPATAATAPEASGFRIQVASMHGRSDALALQARLNKAGFKAYTQTVDLGEKGQWFRIFSGPYASRTEAERQLPAIEAQARVHGLRVQGG